MSGKFQNWLVPKLPDQVNLKNPDTRRPADIAICLCTEATKDGACSVNNGKDFRCDKCLFNIIDYEHSMVSISKAQSLRDFIESKEFIALTL